MLQRPECGGLNLGSPQEGGRGRLRSTELTSDLSLHGVMHTVVNEINRKRPDCVSTTYSEFKRVLHPSSLFVLNLRGEKDLPC